MPLYDNWYFHIGDYNFWGEHVGHSRTWSVAKDFGAWLRGSAWFAGETKYTRITEGDISSIASTAKVGDLIAIVNDGGETTHWAIISGIKNGMVYIAQHTTDREGDPLTVWLKRNIAVFNINSEVTQVEST